LIGAKGILLSIAGGSDLSLLEVNEAAEVIRRGATDDTNIIFGATIDERLSGQMWVTVVATGLRDKSGHFERPVRERPLFGRGTDDELLPPSFLTD
jgi:cell division protein FtsZ